MAIRKFGRGEVTEANKATEEGVVKQAGAVEEEERVFTPQDRQELEEENRRQ